MNLGALALIATILISLAAVPFLIPEFEPTLKVTGNFLSGLNSSSTEEYNSLGIEEIEYTPDRFRRTIQTPEGKYVLEMTHNQTIQKLTNPTKKVTIITTPDSETRIFSTTKYKLSISKTPTEEVTILTTPHGTLRVTKELGNVTERWYGNQSYLQSIYQEAIAELNRDMKRMRCIGLEITGSSVLINEILPNPLDDDATMPDGEWVELYNVGCNQINLDGWYVEDGDGNRIYIDEEHTGTTIIQPNGFLVVYMNHAVLNNNGDMIVLYDGNGKVRDKYIYDFSVDEEKSISRCPNGEENWIITFPTPEEPNEC